MKQLYFASRCVANAICKVTGQRAQLCTLENNHLALGWSK